MRLELTAEAAGLLEEVLTEYLSDLRMEIADTDSQPLREALKKRELALRSILEQLAG